MNKFNINDFVRGWFIGDFDHSLHKTTGFEVAVKFYNKGELHPQHVHKIGTEYTVVTTGRIRMNNQLLTRGEGLTVSPGIWSDFEALEDCSLVVVKIPSVLGDKYE